MTDDIICDMCAAATATHYSRNVGDLWMCDDCGDLRDYWDSLSRLTQRTWMCIARSQMQQRTQQLRKATP